jgi:purine catabolism regulator
MAGVTVEEVLTLAPMAGAAVIGGRAGLSRLVTGVNVMEVPDIEAFVKPGEILLTTGFPVHDRPERLVELVPELAARGLAALAVKPLRYLAQLPPDLARAADAADLPVIVMPDGTSFNEVIGAVLAVVLADYGADPSSADQIRERLTGVALSGGGLDGIAGALTAALGRDVAILDPAGYVLGTSTGSTAPPAAPTGSPEGWTFPVMVGGAERGRVVVAGDAELTLGQRRLVRQSCFAAAMHIAQALASLELDRKLRTLFLEELVTGVDLDEPTIRQRSHLYGWDLSGQHHVLVARGRTELSDTAISAAASDRLPAGSLAWSRGTEVVAIVPVGGPARPPRRRAARPVELVWREALVRLGAGDVVVSVGTLAAATSDLADSHVTAREAIGIALATGRSTVRYDDLQLEQLLLANPRGALERFVDHHVGALVRHDDRTSGDLCQTLEAYLGLGSGAAAARRLFIHYNTLKHRLHKIAELTNADLHDPRTRLAMSLALEARKLVGADAASPTPSAGAAGRREAGR